jgi:hypothetical protein
MMSTYRSRSAGASERGNPSLKGFRRFELLSIVRKNKASKPRAGKQRCERTGTSTKDANGRLDERTERRGGASLKKRRPLIHIG